MIVCSLIKPTIHRQLEECMHRRGVALLCAQEAKVAQTTHYVVGDLLFVVHGHGGDEQERAGIGMIFRGDPRRCITGFELGAAGRIMAVGLDLAPRRLTVTSVYMPQSRRPEEERAGGGGMSELSALIEASLRKGPAIVLGDFNARIHGK